MRGMQVTQDFAELADILAGQDRAYVEVARKKRRSVQHRSEAADNDEFDISVAKALQQVVDIAHEALCPLFPARGPDQRFLVMDGALLVRIRQAFVDQAEIDASTFRCLDGI